MKRTLVLAATVLTLSWWSGPLLVAKGSGGHGGGHSGGHASGGHSAGHGSGGGSSHGHASTSGGAHHSGSGSHSAGTTACKRGDHPNVCALPVDHFMAGPSIFEPFFIASYRPRLHGQWVSPSYGLLGYSYYAGVCATPDCSEFVESYPPVPPATEMTEGNLRLDVKPVSAQVFVDGYFVGTVEDFYHTLAGLALNAGPHHLEFRAVGYETLTIDVAIDANRTITYRVTLKRQQ